MYALILLVVYYALYIYRPEVGKDLSLTTILFAIALLIRDLMQMSYNASMNESNNKHEEVMARLSIEEPDAKEA